MRHQYPAIQLIQPSDTQRI